MGFLGSKSAIDSLVKQIKDYKDSPEGIAEMERLNNIFDNSKKCCTIDLPCNRKCQDNSNRETCYNIMISKFKIMKEYPEIWRNLISIPSELQVFYLEEYKKWIKENEG